MTPARVVVLLLAGVQSLLTAAWVLRANDDGPVVLVLTTEHGLHSSDVPVVVLWVVVMLGCAWVWWNSPPDDADRR